LTNTWTEFVPRVYSNYPELLAEMYAYSMAAAHEKLPHATYEHFMVSNTDMYAEGWPLVDKLGDEVCTPPVAGLYFPSAPLPNFLHYCQEYRIAQLSLYKRYLPSDKMLDCMESFTPFPDPLPKLGLIDQFTNGKGEVSIRIMQCIYIYLYTTILFSYQIYAYIYILLIDYQDESGAI